jgi:hypothetical protein
MADINIDNFYRHIAKILSMLYSAFPTRSPIYVDDVAGIDEPDEYGLHSPHYTAGFFALIWLADEGFLRYSDTIRQDGIDQAALTNKAFMRLSQPVERIYLDPDYSPDENLDKSPDKGPDKSNVVNLAPAENLSPSIIEDRKMVINQLRFALKRADSIAIAKVVQHILQSD